jgi:hypothetical protein
MSGIWIAFKVKAVRTSPPPKSASAATLISTLSTHEPSFNHTDTAPHLGLITLGAFAPEAVPDSAISIADLDSDLSYGQYRAAIHECYGVDLADMNYLGVGMPDWQSRYNSLDDWLHRAGKYGDPTLAIEPIGANGFGIFRPGPEMADLRSVFVDAANSGIIVWVRFASESNLKFSVYSVYNNSIKIGEYRRAVRWFRAYMPSNVKLVFSPLINTVYLHDPRQLATIVSMYEPGAYDRIGGTLYATSWLRPKIAFDWYYHFMRRLDRKTPFQICELGGIYPRSEEITAFLIRVAQGQWPGVQRVNLFAGDLNSLAINQHGHFGFILPGAIASYLAPLLSSGPNPAILRATTAELDHMEELGAGWQSLPMTLEGKLVAISSKTGDFDLVVSSVTDNDGFETEISPKKLKRIILTDRCAGTNLIRSSAKGLALSVVGWDSGAGTPLRATEISRAASE